MECLYDNYANALYGVTNKILRNQQWSEEVLQDSFIKVWERIDLYDPKKGRLFTWMMNIVRNKAIDKLRSAEIRQANKSDSIAEVVSIVDQTGSEEQNTDVIGLAGLLGKLDEDHRFVVNMIYLRGYTHSELAKESGIPLGTIKTRLRNALIQLRRELGLV